MRWSMLVEEGTIWIKLAYLDVEEVANAFQCLFESGDGRPSISKLIFENLDRED